MALPAFGVFSTPSGIKEGGGRVGGGWDRKKREGRRGQGGGVKGEGAKNKLNSKDKFVLVFKL